MFGVLQNTEKILDRVWELGVTSLHHYLRRGEGRVLKKDGDRPFGIGLPGKEKTDSDRESCTAGNRMSRGCGMQAAETGYCRHSVEPERSMAFPPKAWPLNWNAWGTRQNKKKDDPVHLTNRNRGLTSKAVWKKHQEILKTNSYWEAQNLTLLLLPIITVVKNVVAF